tara:strand:+ start:1144 stop:1893 length:750 start_codon:yes stop_codon:yes gene_type:complete
MFKNGRDIYHELDVFNKIPKQLEQDRLNNLFNTQNIIKENILNDNYINTIKQKYNVDTDIIINSILMHLRPVLFSNQTIDNTNIEELKTKVDNTLNFELNYMNKLENQIEFLFSNTTFNHIRNKVNDKIKDLNIEVKNDFIKKMMIHEINNFRSRYGDNKNKNSPVDIYNIYTNKMSLFKARDIFSIINDVIEKISSNLYIEHNMMKNNNKLDRWNTILGVNNEHGLRRHTNIKLNEKKPKGMLFNMTF